MKSKVLILSIYTFRSTHVLQCRSNGKLCLAENDIEGSIEPTLYVGMAWVKSQVVGIQNASKLSENA